MTTKQIRFGLIGFGLFGKHHAAAITATDGAQLAAIAVKSQQSQAAARETYPESDIVGDYHLLLSRDDIDVVCIVVPNTMHHQVARDGLLSGKHLLLEKPMALRRRSCRQLGPRRADPFPRSGTLVSVRLRRAAEESIDSGKIVSIKAFCT